MFKEKNELADQVNHFQKEVNEFLKGVRK